MSSHIFTSRFYPPHPLQSTPVMNIYFSHTFLSKLANRYVAFSIPNTRKPKVIGQKLENTPSLQRNKNKPAGDCGYR